MKEGHENKVKVRCMNHTHDNLGKGLSYSRARLSITGGPLEERSCFSASTVRKQIVDPCVWEIKPPNMRNYHD